MSIRAHISYGRPGRGLFERSEVSAAAAEGNAVAVEYWHTFFMPLHFTAAAVKRYGYQPRSGENERAYVPSKRGIVLRGGRTFYGNARVKPNPKYFWRKQREGKGKIPLVYSGASEQAAKQIRITSSASRGVGVLFALPKYFYAYRKDLKQPDKAAELTVVLDEEARQMGRAAEQTMAAVLNGQRPTAPRAA